MLEIFFTQELAQAAVLAEADQASDAPEKGKHTVQLFLEDFAQPCLIQMSKDATVGSITVAEEQLGTLTQPIHCLFLHWYCPQAVRTDHSISTDLLA